MRRARPARGPSREEAIALCPGQVYQGASGAATRVCCRLTRCNLANSKSDLADPGNGCNSADAHPLPSRCTSTTDAANKT